jgi:hypothetical protein
LATDTWTGASGVDNHWTTPGNWAGNQTPVQGDNLVFALSNDPVSYTSFNDFPAGTAFGSITFGQAFRQPYVLQGNAIVLNGGLFSQLGDQISFGAEIDLAAISLGQDQTFALQFTPDHGIVINSPVDLQAFNLTITDAGEVETDFAGSISGTGGLIINGGGGGVGLFAANTFSGPVVANNSVLGIADENALGTSPIGTTINGGTLTIVPVMQHPLTQFNLTEPLKLNGEILLSEFPFTANFSAPITLTGPSSFSFFGSPNTQAAVAINAPINTNGFNLSFSSTIGGQLSPEILSSVTGTGSVLFNGQTLSGSGSIEGPLAVNQGTFSPGIGSTKAAVFSVGTLSMAAQSGFQIDIQGPDPGVGYSQLVSAGAVDLGGSNLNLALNYVPKVTDSFVILKSSGPLTGTFQGLPEGSILRFPNGPLQIHYINGPSGGEVVLTHPVLFATGADFGGGPDVRVFGANGSLLREFLAYDPTFRGGVRVAVADVNGDGVPDIITVPGPTGGPDVRVFDGATGALIKEFLAYDPHFLGGLFVAALDLISTGKVQIVTAPDQGGGPDVRVFDGSTLSMTREFMAYDPAFLGGARLAIGDVNGDGTPDIITAPGPGGGPDVRVLDGATGQLISEFMAYDPAFRGGVYVAAGDLNKDGKAEIVTSPGAGGGPDVRIFDGATGQMTHELLAYDPLFAGGVRVSVADVTGSGQLDIITAAGPGGGPNVRVFDGMSLGALDGFFAYDPLFMGGVYVGAG